MDLLRLDKTTYLADKYVEVRRRDEMVWVERFVESGDFVFKTTRIQETMEALPLESFISLRDTKEVMQVETFSIEESTEGVDWLTVSGRSVETFLENRANLGYLQKIPYDGAGGTFSVGSYLQYELANILGHNGSYEFLAVDATPRDEDFILTWVPYDLTTEHPTVIKWDIPLQAVEAYGWLLDCLKRGKVGVRNVRPTVGGAAELRLEIYDGLDRSVDQTVNAPVVFSHKRKDITKPKYLWTVRDKKNVGYMTAELPYRGRFVLGAGVSATISGWDRRDMVMEGTQKGDSATTNNAYLDNLGKTELAKRQRTEFFEAEASPRSSHKYGVDYTLGDYVTLRGNYGLSKTMIVSEYVRVKDADGERAYPTVTNPEE